MTPKSNPSNTAVLRKKPAHFGRQPVRKLVRASTSTGTPAHEPTAKREDIIRVIPLGGVEEVGRNMVIIEVGGDIIVSDMGFEFVTETDAPGVSYVLPNVK